MSTPILSNHNNQAKVGGTSEFERKLEGKLGKKGVNSLKQAGITLKQFNKYLKMFCWNRERDRFAKLTPSSWKTIHKNWWPGLIADHLAECEMLGLVPKNQTDCLIFDLDNHNPEKLGPVEDRARKLIQEINCEPLVYTSSDSGGLRIAYFLDGRYPKKMLRSVGENLVKKAGLKVSGGSVEIMADNKIDRLPFGEHSYLVDQHLFQPIYSKSKGEMIEYAWDIREEHRLSLAEYVQSAATKESDGFVAWVDRLWVEGLPPEDEASTNDCLLELAWELLARRRCTRDETVAHLCNWIKVRHNGHSNRMNNGKYKDIEAQIKRIVSQFRIDKCSNGKSGLIRLPANLTIGDIEQITELADDSRTQYALYDLLKFVRNRGRRLDLKEALALINEPLQGLLISNKYVSALKRVTVCEIPSKSFRRFSGFDSGKYKEMYNRLHAMNLIFEIRGYSSTLHRCKTFLIAFEFHDDSEEVGSLEEGLDKLKEEGTGDNIPPESVICGRADQPQYDASQSPAPGSHVNKTLNLTEVKK